MSLLRLSGLTITSSFFLPFFAHQKGDLAPVLSEHSLDKANTNYFESFSFLLLRGNVQVGDVEQVGLKLRLNADGHFAAQNLLVNAIQRDELVLQIETTNFE